MQYKIKWTGDSLPSKKNSRRIVRSKGRPILLSSKEYLEWEQNFIADLETVEKPQIFEKITCRITAKDRRPFDLSNKWESIADAMVKCGYIEDDSVRFIPKLELEFSGYSKQKKWEIELIFE